MTVLFVIIGLLVLVGLFVVATYNGLVGGRNKVDAAWSQIDVQMKRRIDLIPNLVETVKGYAAHEKGTLEAVVNARNAAVGASTPGQVAAADNQITGALRQLFALSEAYPDLKANTNFLELQEELSTTEDRISYARQAYNDTAQRYNDKVQKVPGNFIAGPFGFKVREYFQAEEAARTAPTVKF
jgi:LemA protein